MKTKAVRSKAKPAAKARSGKAESEREIPPVRHNPSEEEISELALILFNQRLDRGQDGTAEGDWLQAEEYLSYQEE